MKCPKCEFENEEEAKFCLDCGERLEIECPLCGKAFPLFAKFCNQCGQDLRQLAETHPIDFNRPQSYTPKFLAD